MKLLSRTKSRSRAAHPSLRAPRSALRACRGFTMVEIAISLAVIGFALVAIIGILPSGMNVQKDNREETIINQDGNYWIGTLRYGAQGTNNLSQTALGLDDLTNYVVAITNYWTDRNQSGAFVRSNFYGYTYSQSSVSPPFLLTNGFRIIGLLGTPKYEPAPPQIPGGIRSNHVVAFVRALSGVASEKSPQDNATVQEGAFAYRMISEVLSYNSYDSSWTDPNNPAFLGTNYWNFVRNRQENLHEMRLTFRWPLYANGTTGNGKQTFRVMTGGPLIHVAGTPLESALYFFQPQTYVQINPP